MNGLRRSLVQAALSSCLILLSSTFNISIIAQQTPKSSAQMARVSHDADSLVLDVSVTDKKGNHIDGLDKSAFALYDNKVQQEITFFAGGDEPASIGIILDLSGSMPEKKLKTARNALLRFMELSHSANDYFFIAFASRTRLLIDWERDRKIAAEEFSKYNITAMRGSSAMYDSCYLAVEKMRSGAHPKQAILLISDGQDNESSYTYSDVRRRLKESGVLFYGIGLRSGDDSGSALGIEGESVLSELSAVSGGKAYFPHNEKTINEAFDYIATELRHQYVLGFKPSKETADGQWHQIKIKVTPPFTAKGKKQSLLVRHREGHYAAKILR